MISSSQLVEQRRVPVLYVYSESGGEVAADGGLNAEYAEMFGADRQLADRYDADGRLTTDLCPKTGNLRQ